MSKTNRINHLPKYVFYSEDDEGYIAIVPTLPGLSAFGETEEEAIHELAVATVAFIATAKEHNPYILSINYFDRISNLLNVSELAKRAHLRPSTLSSKIKRHTPLSEDESNKIQQALAESGLLATHPT